MLAEASGVAAELDVGRRARSDRGEGDWFTCFPGFAMLTTGPRLSGLSAGPAVSPPSGVLRARVRGDAALGRGVCRPC